jgi:hypothetical protein
MKAISLWQPWAWLVAIGAKRFETRSWSTNHRGFVAIHAASRWDRRLQHLAHSEPFKKYWTRRDVDNDLGAIIAVAWLDNVMRSEVAAKLIRLGDFKRILINEELAFGNYTAGRYAFEFEDVARTAEPIFTRGYQKIWNLPEDVAAKVSKMTPDFI